MSDLPSEERQVIGNQPIDAGSASESLPAKTNPVSTVRPLRIWPAVLLLISLWAARIVPTLFDEMSVPLVTTRFMGLLLLQA